MRIHQKFTRHSAIMAMGSLWLTGLYTALAPGTVGAQVFVVNATSNGTVGEYSLTGAPINTAFATGLRFPHSVLVTGSNVFISEQTELADYTTSGTPVNTSLDTNWVGLSGLAAAGSTILAATVGGNTIAEMTTSGVELDYYFIQDSTLDYPLDNPNDIAISGSNIFITNELIGTVSEFTSSGAMVNAALISNLGHNDPCNIAASGSDLYITNSAAGTVSVYTTDGTLVNAALVSGLSDPYAIAIAGSDIFITNNDNCVSEYALDGTLVNASFITGLQDPTGIFVSVPEPTAGGFLALAGLGVLKRRQRRRPHGA